MAKSKRPPEKSVVNRITVDERLSESLVRLLIAPLKKQAETITEDSTEDWGKERPRDVTPKNFLTVLGLQKNSALMRKATTMVLEVEEGQIDQKQIDRPERLLWRELTEGQVFLSGRCEATETGGRLDFPIIVRSDLKWNFLRIDRFPKVRDGIKRLYSAALTGRKDSDDKTH
jgi:hypothetical protein